ncbi:DNA cytosine methyltransferase [Vannielia litorea]|uniref:DNA cytosine methyltransferase n=1 Tax=Vannielia litorea TaxID=1217970 RepID=UPI001BCB9A19|nr:DNA cytosine methyltransferase [Vannielia litorea]
MPTFQEFFAGGGMVRAGLSECWTCLFANDIDPAKAQTYTANWGEAGFVRGDVASLSAEDLGQRADLSWASFPCQDLSLAGGGAGLAGTRSGAFRAYWHLIEELVTLERQPSIVVLENVMGAVTSHGGKDFETLCSAYSDAGYRFGAFSLDAVNFLPQSRKRLFFVGVSDRVSLSKELVSQSAVKAIHTRAIRAAHSKLPESAKRKWLWWRLPDLPPKCTDLMRYLNSPEDHLVHWDSPEKTKHLLSLMDPINLQKVEDAQRSQGTIVGTLYKRMRKNADGESVQRAEVRFDGVSGCLRVPAGGSSLQTLVIVREGQVQTRNMSPRETAALMGLSSSYKLPNSATSAYRVTGDGVAVPIVSFLRKHLFEPLLTNCEADQGSDLPQVTGSEIHLGVQLKALEAERLRAVV